jgi:hypothetical protein
MSHVSVGLSSLFLKFFLKWKMLKDRRLASEHAGHGKGRDSRQGNEWQGNLVAERLRQEHEDDFIGNWL